MLIHCNCHKSMLLIFYIIIVSAKCLWTQLGDDINGEVAFGWFGRSVAMNGKGDTIAISAYGNNRVRVYMFDDSEWTQLGDAIDGNDQFGWSVAMNDKGDTIAISSVLHDGATGRVGVYMFDGSEWTQFGDAIDGEADDDEFGWSVAMNDKGDTIAIGATGHRGGAGNNIGRVRVYMFDGAQWAPLGDGIDGEVANDRFGWSVAMNGKGDIIAISSVFHDGGAGHVRVYMFDGSEWTQLGDAIDGEVANDEFGWSVAMNDKGDTIAIGATGFDISATGRVGVYMFDGSEWIQLGGDINGEAANDQFGFSIAMNDKGDTIAISATGYDGGAGNNIGHVRVYMFDGAQWAQLGDDFDGEAANNRLGSSVAMNNKGDTIAISTKRQADNNIGRARVYTTARGDSICMRACKRTCKSDSKPGPDVSDDLFGNINGNKHNTNEASDASTITNDNNNSPGSIGTKDAKVKTYSTLIVIIIIAVIELIVIFIGLSYGIYHYMTKRKVTKKLNEMEMIQNKYNDKKPLQKTETN